MESRFPGLTAGPDDEADVQDVFLTRLALDAHKHYLLAANEHGLRVNVAIDGRAATSAS